MLENKNKYGFTLSELITALGIIGILAAMSVPALFENINKRTFTANLKSVVAQVEQLANVQMATKGTKDLNLTDFSSPSKLFSDKNFMAVKKCSASEAKANCWENIDKYKTIAGKDESIASTYDSIILKNGTTIAYKNLKYPVFEMVDGSSKQTTTTVGRFCVDLNGAKEKPNRSGRDYFCFYIDYKGRIVGSRSLGTVPINTTISLCNGNASSVENCFDAVFQSGWHMDY